MKQGVFFGVMRKCIEIKKPKLSTAHTYLVRMSSVDLSVPQLPLPELPERYDTKCQNHHQLKWQSKKELLRFSLTCDVLA